MKVILFLLLSVAGLVLCVRFIESTSLFYPTRDLLYNPHDFGLNFEDIYFSTQDGSKLNGWYVPADKSRATVLFFHGNAGNIGDRMGKIQLFHNLNLNVFIFDYRGYGKSAGKPTEKGMYEDALAAYDHLIARQDTAKDKIVLYGASLGGTAAIDLATKRKVRGLILDSTFTNAQDMARRIYPFIPSFMLTLQLDSLSKVKNLTVPKLFIHSVDDEMVPYDLGKKLYESAALPKEFVSIQGSHNDGHVYDEEKFVGAIDQFIGQWLP